MIYNINFGTGKLEPIDESKGNKNNLPMGTILQLYGYDCPHYVITANLGLTPTWESQGANYECFNIDKGGTSRHQAYSLAWLRDKKDNRIQTYITDRVLTPDEMQMAIAKGTAIKEENDRLARIEAEKKAADKASLPSRFPYLTPQDGTQKDRILATKNIKVELKRTYPSIKFSIKSESYSGGDSINVSWTDGPIQSDVAKITDKYQEGHFNGMEDIYENSGANWPDVFGGAKYVFANRHESAELTLKVAKDMGFDLPSGSSDNYGVLSGLDHETSQMIYRRTRETAVDPIPENIPDPIPLKVEAVTIRKNEEKGGIEVIFPAKPLPSVIDRLKSMGFRWSKFQGLWWRKFDADIMAQIQEVTA